MTREGRKKLNPIREVTPTILEISTVVVRCSIVRAFAVLEMRMTVVDITPWCSTAFVYFFLWELAY